METSRTEPSRRGSFGATLTLVIAVIALIAVLAIGVYVVAMLNEVIGFARYLNLAYGGWG